MLIVLSPWAAAERLTPQMAFESTRIFDERVTAAGHGFADDSPVSFSPKGDRWVARLVRGDVARDGVWMEIVSGGGGSLEEANKARMVARLFTSGLGSASGALMAGKRRARGQ